MDYPEKKRVYHTNFRYFSGYKPCQFMRQCEGCDHYDRVGERVIIVSLEALGAVLRSTCLLHPLKRRFPKGHITWLTMPNAIPLLEQNPLIDRILTLDVMGLAALQRLEFDYLYGLDKSIAAGSLAETIKAEHRFGFGLTASGAIRPLSEAGEYQYAVGLDNDLKFFRNQKPETQQLTESMAFKWERDPYVLELSQNERMLVEMRRRTIMASGASSIIGYNTGCSALFPYKKLTVECSIELIRMWRQEFPMAAVALLGGREDSERQTAMKAAFALDSWVLNVDSCSGLRSGILWTAVSDLVFSGCSLGMHIGIGLNIPTIAWFGVSCAQEVDLYDRGTKVHAAVTCSPCWLKTCDRDPKCYNRVPFDEVKKATRAWLPIGEVR